MAARDSMKFSVLDQQEATAQYRAWEEEERIKADKAVPKQASSFFDFGFSSLSLSTEGEKDREQWTSQNKDNLWNKNGSSVSGTSSFLSKELSLSYDDYDGSTSLSKLPSTSSSMSPKQAWGCADDSEEDETDFGLSTIPM